MPKNTTSLTVAGSLMTAAQRTVAETLLNVGENLNAPGTALVAIIYAGIWESKLTPLTTPNSDNEVGVLQSSASVWNGDDVKGQATSFFKGGKGFQGGGAIALVRSGITNPIQVAVEVEVPSIWPNNAYAAEQGYIGDTAAKLEAANIVQTLGHVALSAGGVFGLGGTGNAANSVPVSLWMVANSSNPAQDYWTTMNQYAQNAQLYFFSDGEYLFLADGIELLAQTPQGIISSMDPNVIQINPVYDNTSWSNAYSHVRKSKVYTRAALARVTSPTQVSIRIICDIDKYRGGDTVQLALCGPADGVWLIGERRRSVFQPYSDLTLVPGTAPINANSGLPLGPAFESGKSATLPGSGTVYAAMVSRANAINGDDYQYRWGGGHAQAGTPSIGAAGGPPGSAGPPPGFDCSGAVAAVLAAGGLWPLGSSVPGDSGIPAQLKAKGFAVDGPGSGRPECTLWNLPGVHIYMTLDGQVWGTDDSSGHLPATPNEGVGWIPQGVAGGNGFIPYHIRPDILGQQASAVASNG